MSKVRTLNEFYSTWLKLYMQVAQLKFNMNANQTAVATAALSVERDLRKLDLASAAAAARARAQADCGTWTNVSCAACSHEQTNQDAERAVYAALYVAAASGGDRVIKRKRNGSVSVKLNRQWLHRPLFHFLRYHDMRADFYKVRKINRKNLNVY